jgi:hypothetical protein
MIVLMFIGGIVVDSGYVFSGRTDLQAAVDSAALAALPFLLDHDYDGATNEAVAYAAANSALGTPVVLNGATDVEFGTWDWDTRTFVLGGTEPNAVRVTARRTTGSPGGPLPLFFGRFLGQDEAGVSATAIGALDPRVKGLEGGLIPFTADIGYIDADGDGEYDIGRTIDFFPFRHSPGNFGTLDFDAGSNPTPVLGGWIRYGYDQPFVIPPDPGYVDVEGDPGISDGIKDDVAARIGDVVVITVHSYLGGQGGTTQYRVTGLVAVRIIDAKLTGPLEDRFIQAEIVRDAVGSGIPDPGVPPNPSVFLPRLAR